MTTMVTEGGDQVVAAPLVVVPLAVVGRLGVGCQALGNEIVVASGEGARVSRGQLTKAASAGVVARRVDLDEQGGEPRSHAVWVVTGPGRRGAAVP